MAIGDVMAKLGIEIDGSDARKGERVVRRSLTNIKRDSRQTTTSVNKLDDAFGRMKRTALALISGYGLARLGKSFLDTAVRMEDYRLRLNAVIKDQREANKTFEEINRWASMNPVDTDEAIGAFVRLKTAAVENTQGALQAVGDLASVMGRNMQDVASAIVSTEVEPLRNMGILLDRTGKKAIITSGNVRVEVEKDINAIRSGIIEVIQKQFGGAIDDMASSWRGAVNTIRGMWTMLQQDLMNAGAFETLRMNINDLRLSFEEWMNTEDYQNFIDMLSNQLVAAIKGVVSAGKAMADAIGWLIDHKEAVIGVLVAWKSATWGLKAAVAGEAMVVGATTSAGLVGAIGAVSSVLGPMVATGGLLVGATGLIIEMTGEVEENAKHWQNLSNKIGETKNSIENYAQTVIENQSVLGVGNLVDSVKDAQQKVDNWMRQRAMSGQELRNNFSVADVVTPIYPGEVGTEGKDITGSGLGSGNAGLEQLENSIKNASKNGTEQGIAEGAKKIQEYIPRETKDRMLGDMSGIKAFGSESYEEYAYEAIPAFQEVNVQLKSLEDQTGNVDSATKQLQENTKRWAQDFQDGIAQAIVYGRNLGDVLDGILKQLAEMVIKSLLFGGKDGKGGLLSFIGLPFMASGGPVSANSPYVVGEEGPELFVPKTSGKIVPNDQVASGSSGSDSQVGSNHTTINMSIQAIDAQGVMEFFTKNKGQVQKVVVESIAQNGSVRSAIKRSL